MLRSGNNSDTCLILPDGSITEPLVDPNTQKWTDPNNPYPKFFKPLVNTLKNLKQEGTPYNEIKAKWHSFLTSGNQTLKDEPDDKTMILGVLMNQS